MAWIFLHRSIELLLLHLLWKEFHLCSSGAECLALFLRLPDLTQIGIVTVVIVVFASIGKTLFDLVKWINGKWGGKSKA